MKKFLQDVAVTLVFSLLLFVMDEGLTVFANTVKGEGVAVVSGGDIVVESVSDEATTAETARDEYLAADTVSGGDVVVDTVSGGDVTTEVVDNDEITPVDCESADELVVIEEEEVALADMPELVFEEEVNGVTVRLTAPCDAFEEGTEMVVKEVEAVDAVIEKAEQEKQTTIQKYRAFDIKLVKEGKEVEPLNGRTVEVTFEGDMILPSEGEDVTVYHVDEKNEITDVDAVVVNKTETTGLSMLLQ